MDAISRLAAVSFLKDLTLEDLQKLASVTKRLHFVAGEDVVKQGDLTNRFFVVDEGVVGLRRTDTEGFEKPLGSRGPGTWFCEDMFLSQAPSVFTAEPIDSAWLYVLTCDDFEALTNADPDLLKRMPEIATKRRNLTRGFKWLTPGEYVAYATHRHNLALVTALALPIGVGIVLLLLIGAAMFFNLLAAIDLPNLNLYLIGGVLLIMVPWSLYQWHDWADDDFIVTNKRVIHVEKKYFTSETRDEVPINRIQETIVHLTNPVESGLGISTLEIKTSGRDQASIEFDHVANAAQIRQIIDDQRKLLRARLQAEDRERFRSRVSSELRHYVTRIPMEEKKTPPPPPPKRSFVETIRAIWHQMFGSEFRHGTTVTWRKHWVALWLQLKFWPLLLLLLVVIMAAYLLVPVLSVVPQVGFFAVWGLALVIILGKMGWEWEDWRNDVYQVTETLILDLERLPFGFNSKETTAPLVNVQDARVTREGFLANIFNFGNVHISMGGSAPSIVFYNVKNPQAIQAEVFRRIEEVKKRQRDRETALQSRNIVDAVVAYHRLLMQEQATKVEEQSTSVTQVNVIVPPTPEGALEPPPPVPAPAGPPVTDREPVVEFPPANAYQDE